MAVKTVLESELQNLSKHYFQDLMFVFIELAGHQMCNQTRIGPLHKI